MNDRVTCTCIRRGLIDDKKPGPHHAKNNGCRLYVAPDQCGEWCSAPPLWMRLRPCKNPKGHTGDCYPVRRMSIREFAQVNDLPEDGGYPGV